MKCPDGSQHSSVALGILSVTHIMPVLVLLSVVKVGMQQCMIQNHIVHTCMDANIQLTINRFMQLFPDKIFSLIFSKIPDISLTTVKFPNISRQVVSLSSSIRQFLTHCNMFPPDHYKGMNVNVKSYIAIAHTAHCASERAAGAHVCCTCCSN